MLANPQEGGLPPSRCSRSAAKETVDEVKIRSIVKSILVVKSLVLDIRAKLNALRPTSWGGPNHSNVSSTRLRTLDATPEYCNPSLDNPTNQLINQANYQAFNCSCKFMKGFINRSKNIGNICTYSREASCVFIETNCLRKPTNSSNRSLYETVKAVPITIRQRSHQVALIFKNIRVVGGASKRAKPRYGALNDALF